MTISSWRLSSCEDPLLFEIPADTSQPKGDAIQAVHNFLGDLAQCGEPRHPCHGAIHQPLDFPALAPPVNQLGPDGPNMAHVGPVGPHRRPCGPSLDHRRQVCSLVPHALLDGWGLFKPLETQISWHDIFNVVWLSSTTAPMFNHRPEDPSWVKSPDTQAMSTWTIQYNRPQLNHNSNREGQFIAEGCFIWSTSSCFGELFNMNRVLNSFRYFPPLVKR